jgi:hypothetical protein
MNKSLQTLGILLLVSITFVNCELFRKPDYEKPSISFTDLQDGETVSGTVVIKVTARDNREVFKVSFIIDNLPLGEDTRAPYEMEWNTGELPLGQHTIGISAIDPSGNMNSTSITVTTVSDGSVQGTTLFQDFNTYNAFVIDPSTTNVLLPPWDAVAVNASVASIEEDSTGAGREKIFHIDDADADGDYAQINANFEGMTEGMLTFDFYLKEGTTFFIQLFYDEQGVDAETGIIVLVTEDISGTYLIQKGRLIPVSLDEWHNIRIVFDCMEHTYTVIFDDLQLDTEIAFFNNTDMDVLNLMEIEASSYGPDAFDGIMQDGDFFLDDIEVTSEVEPGAVAEQPSVPANVSATNDEAAAITVSWDDVVGAVKYRIYRSENEGSGYENIAYITDPGTASVAVEMDSTTPPAHPVVPGTGYYFKVTAVNALGVESLLSNSAFGGASLFSVPDDFSISYDYDTDGFLDNIVLIEQIDISKAQMGGTRYDKYENSSGVLEYEHTTAITISQGGLYELYLYIENNGLWQNVGMALPPRTDPSIIPDSKKITITADSVSYTLQLFYSAEKSTEIWGLYELMETFAPFPE